jgi:predicted Zn-ribbon and HTH transcriptional regulator
MLHYENHANMGYQLLISQAVCRAKSTLFHSKPVISPARIPVANAKRTKAAKCGGHA